MAKVMVVDDSSVARAVTRMLLGKLGHESVECASVDEAWHYLSQGDLPDLVLLDWNMPGGNGMSLVHMMAETPRTSAVPIVFATSDNDFIHKGYAEDSGAVGYLVKPFSRDELSQAIESALLP